MNQPGDDSYARAGVSQSRADQAVDLLVGALKGIDPGRPSKQVELPGHYAAVIALDDQTGIAMSTDGVGTKLLIAEELGRYETIGIDCIAMNVNDVICVGARPLAMLDYLAVEEADPGQCEQIGIGLARGAELAGIEIPGGELAQLGSMIRGFDIAGACFGTVRLDSVIDGSAVQPGDAIIGLPSSGIHSNGYTLARSALGGLPLGEPFGDSTLGEVLLEPTEIYVRAILDLLDSPVTVNGLAHITSGGLENLLRLRSRVDYLIDAPLEPQAIFGLIQDRASIPDHEMYEVFNMGCGFCCVVPAQDRAEALEVLRGHYPGAQVIGSVVEGEGRVKREA